VTQGCFDAVVLPMIRHDLNGHGLWAHILACCVPKGVIVPLWLSHANTLPCSIDEADGTEFRQDQLGDMA